MKRKFSGRDSEPRWPGQSRQMRWHIRKDCGLYGLYLFLLALKGVDPTSPRVKLDIDGGLVSLGGTCLIRISLAIREYQKILA